MSLDIKATFEVVKITGTFTRTVIAFEETNKTRIINGVERILTTRKMMPVTETFEDGYDIYYPQGHHIFVAADDTDQLNFLGVLDAPRRVDMSSGEDVPEEYDLSPKEIVERKQRNRPRATQGGIAAAMEG